MTTQIQEIKNEGLAREFTVKVPRSVIDQAFNARLQEVGKTANIQGFRPGKIPLKILEQRFGGNVRAEVLDDAVNKEVEKTLTDRNLRPAMQPKVELVSFSAGQDLEFKLALEVLPEIAPMDFSSLGFERAVVDVPDSKIDETVNKLAKESRESATVTESRAARMGDVVVIDFDGTVDGERQAGMKSEDHELELGSKSFIDTFEEQLVGLKVGDKKDVTVKFPDEYHAKNLAGKTAVFAVTVKELREFTPVEINDALAEKAGCANLAELRQKISEAIGAGNTKAARLILKRKLMDTLADKHSFPIPQGLVETEFSAIWQEVQKDKAKGELPEEDKNKTDDELRAEYRGIAERRIRLGLLLADVAERNKIVVEQDELRNAVMEQVRRFPGQEQAVFNYLTKTEGAIERLKAPLLEDKIVDFIISKANVTDKKVTAEELVKLSEAANG